VPAGRPQVLVATAGTLGDLLPFVALGRRLTAQGREVTIACATGLHDWVNRSGLRAVAFDGDFGREQAQRHAGHWNHWGSVEAKEAAPRLRSFVDKLERNTRDLARLARGAALLITPTNCPEGRLAHELVGTPWISAIFVPEQGLRASAREAGGPAMAEQLDQLLNRLGLSRRVAASWEDLGRSPKALFACSAALGRSEDTALWQTGFWFYDDPDWAQWRPSDELARFMEGPPPLVLSFSSLPLEEPRSVLAVHVRAAHILGRRLVVQQGWGGFSRELLPEDVDPESVWMASFIPHDWFLPRAAALITHGGVGTLGRALRHRCPLLVEPYGNDQFYNALLVKKLGYGSAMNPLRLTAENVARVLSEKVFPTREGLAGAQALIRKEDGLGRACELIEERLAAG